jgi:prepilin-type processing-associated H-X9-DG protein/prepilin-type N-terminal cleavage/methylation domain-containing protein
LKKHANLAGFTLVELLAVVAILVLLITLLFPLVRTALQRAADTKCIGNLRILAVGAHSYAAEHNGRLPSRIQSSNEEGEVNNHSGEQWDAQIAQYIGVDLASTSNRPTPFTCPAAKRNSSATVPLARNLSYGLNRRMQPSDLRPAGPTLASLTNSHTLILIADRQLTEGSNENYVTRAGANNALFIDERPGPTALLPYDRHGGHINILFVDGHVAPRARLGRTVSGFNANHPRASRFILDGATAPAE